LISRRALGVDVCDIYLLRRERVAKLLLGLRPCIVLKVMSADEALNMAAAAWPALAAA